MLKVNKVTLDSYQKYQNQGKPLIGRSSKVNFAMGNGIMDDFTYQHSQLEKGSNDI